MTTEKQEGPSDEISAKVFDTLNKIPYPGIKLPLDHTAMCDYFRGLSKLDDNWSNFDVDEMLAVREAVAKAVEGKDTVYVGIVLTYLLIEVNMLLSLRQNGDNKPLLVMDHVVELINHLFNQTRETVAMMTKVMMDLYGAKMVKFTPEGRALRAAEHGHSEEAKSPGRTN